MSNTLTRKRFKIQNMQSKSFKNFAGVATLLLIVAVLSSCNRGGTGCPYELSIAADVIFQIMK